MISPRFEVMLTQARNMVPLPTSGNTMQLSRPVSSPSRLDFRASEVSQDSPFPNPAAPMGFGPRLARRTQDGDYPARAKSHPSSSRRMGGARTETDQQADEIGRAHV